MPVYLSVVNFLCPLLSYHIWYLKEVATPTPDHDPKNVWTLGRFSSLLGRLVHLLPYCLQTQTASWAKLSPSWEKNGAARSDFTPSRIRRFWASEARLPVRKCLISAVAHTEGSGGGAFTGHAVWLSARPANGWSPARPLWPADVLS